MEMKEWVYRLEQGGRRSNELGSSVGFGRIPRSTQTRASWALRARSRHLHPPVPHFPPVTFSHSANSRNAWNRLLDDASLDLVGEVGGGTHDVEGGVEVIPWIVH